MERILSIIRNNLWYKISAFAIAIIIWTMVHRAIGPTTPAFSEERTVLKQVPVHVLAEADIQGEVVLKPNAVDVTVKGTPPGLRQVRASDVRLYVDISGLKGKARDTRRVQWSVSASGVQVDSTLPRMVEVELR